jgi:tetratricopeptide (TPR) repeat protein
MRVSRKTTAGVLALFAAALALRGAELWRGEPAVRSAVSLPLHAEQPLKAAQSTTANARITFDRDIAPIVFHACAQCHRPGEAGPFSLLSYEDVKSHARQIVSVTQRRFMPPWLPAPGDFVFADELKLTDKQIAAFREWYETGEAEGDAKDLPAPPEFTKGWQLGPPDLILQAAKPYLLDPAAGARVLDGGFPEANEKRTDQYWNFVFRSPVAQTRWVKAVEIRPGNKRLVHHANLLVDRSQSVRREEAAPGEGFAGMELEIESETFDPDGHFLFWKPGAIVAAEPRTMALRIDPGNDLVLNTHLQTSGKPEILQPSLGLYFTDQAATQFPLLLQLECDKQLDIPAGDKDFAVLDEFTLPVDVELLAIYPHAHYLGKDLRAVARMRNGAEKTLIHIPHWDLNWQSVYRYRSPVHLERGTTIVMRYVYDNSADNSANPNDPPARVVSGNRASDEMAHLWLQVLAKDGSANVDARVQLQEALARHHIENNADDFEAHYNLGAILQMRGKPSEAASEYALAQRLRPGDATVENALGGALLAEGKIQEATQHLIAAALARPDYFDARYNLGLAFAAQEDFSRALTEFRAAVKLNPDDANAEANLGGALAASGQYVEAKVHLERALEINPRHALARENLQQILPELPH